MFADISFFESLGKSNGQTSGHTVYNSSLPFLFAEFQKIKKVSDKCNEIMGSIACEEGASILVSAVSEAKRKYDEDLFGLKQKISKEVEDGLDFADRYRFLALEKETQHELRGLVADDAIMREAQKYMAARTAAQNNPAAVKVQPGTKQL